MAELIFLKIAQFFVFMILGFIVVKLGVVKSEDSLVLSKLSLYLLMPSAIINAFDMEVTSSIAKGVALAFVSAIIIHVLLLVLDVLYKLLVGTSSVERASVMYSNAGNMIIPIVSFMLGGEWVIYTTAFLSVQLFFLWTHGVSMFSRERLSIKKILLNVNIIAIILGAVFMVSGVRLPSFAKAIVSDLGTMLGTVGMIIAGMTAAKVDFKSIIKNRRLWLASLFRMVVYPIVFLLLMLVLKHFIALDVAENILLISFLAAIAPAASTVMQFSQLHQKEADLAVSINIVTTVLSIVTMPLFVALFQI